MTDPSPKRVQDHRRTFKIPPVDESTLAWVDAQYDLSLSLRALIRESIAREGIIDVANKPVAQLPRRGRPPLSDLQGTDLQDDESSLSQTDHASSATQELPASAALEERLAPKKPTARRPVSSPSDEVPAHTEQALDTAGSVSAVLFERD